MATQTLQDSAWYANPSYSSYSFAVPTGATAVVTGRAVGSNSSSTRIYVYRQDDINPEKWDPYPNNNTYYIIPPGGTTYISFTFNNLKPGTYKFYLQANNPPSTGSVYN